MIVHELLQEGVSCLRLAKIPDAEIDAALLLGRLLGMSRARLYLNARQVVSSELIDQYNSLLSRRLAREPVAYIVGEQEFWSLSFAVSPAVLIPRPETEELIEQVLAHEKSSGFVAGPVLDLGVGSGAITVVLARELPDRVVWGIDRSWEALLVARQNIHRHGVSANTHLVNGDWLTSLAAKRQFALVVSNPPYIADKEKASLQPEVMDFEPHLALFSGDQGLDDILILAQEVRHVLLPGGWFFMEIGESQGPAVLNIFASFADYDSLAVHKDLAGRPRIFQARCL
ncbi:MAG: peptide chain release factor N(5)-glutamine methyltransferase [Desulfobulbaceae bacterium]|nr:peptide chain release factor N(5)-glutamine methyltransferase [Desulfobulbaceae bacterium]HIJ78840.1 peptide chain release factor N(5)-glutamine methyltransferase [Deltaproteobacteria bacterium]